MYARLSTNSEAVKMPSRYDVNIFTLVYKADRLHLSPTLSKQGLEEWLAGKRPVAPGDGTESVH